VNYLKCIKILLLPWVDILVDDNLDCAKIIYMRKTKISVKNDATGSAGISSAVLPIIIVLIVIAGVFFFIKSKNANNGAVDQNATSTSQDAGVNTKDLQMTIVAEGSGEQAKPGNLVTVDYTGTFPDGTKFDSSIDRGQPLTFILGVGQVIKGWDLGVAGMKVGEKRHLTVPAEYAYGEKGITDQDGKVIIPANQTLIFDIEMKALNTPPAETSTTGTNQ